MSNCIHFIGGAKVVLSKKDVSIPHLRALIANAKQFEYHTSPTKEDGDRNIAWYFLRDNTFFEGDESVVIHVGEGRSIHTNRDFQGLLSVLAPIMKREKQHMFRITDEFDGHQTWYDLRVDFRQGRILR